MKKYVALLRGINVSGQKIIRMAELRAALEQAGLTNVSSYIQSGNLLFESDVNATDLSLLISKIILQEFGYEVPVVIFTPEEIETVISSNPFEVSKQLYVVFTADGFPDDDCFTIGEDVAEVKNGYCFIRYAATSGNSKLSNQSVEKRYGVRSTMRNWNTVLKLRELLK